MSATDSASPSNSSIPNCFPPVFDDLSDDLASAILGFPKPDDKGSLNVGSTIGPGGTPVCLDAARVLPRHILIVGSTGTGKSWLLGKIAEQLHAIGVRMINIDIHGEMNKAISEMGGNILVPGNTLKVPLSSLAEPEILGMVPLVNDLHIDILTRAVINLKSGRKEFGIDELLGEAESVADTYGVKQNTKDIINARLCNVIQELHFFVNFISVLGINILGDRIDAIKGR